jgi:hypothetical protein
MCCSLFKKSEVGRLALLIPIPPLHYILHLHPHLELLSPTLSRISGYCPRKKLEAPGARVTARVGTASATTK